MRLFKSVDERLAEAGFIKVRESDLIVQYEKYEEAYGYTHCLDLLHKASGKHLIQSYEKGIKENGLNDAVGLTMYETRLALKKMRQRGFRELR